MIHSEKKKILITGSNGFIGKNLIINLQEEKIYKLLTFNRGDSFEKLKNLIEESDTIIHLAGENRPKDSEDFLKTNLNLTKEIIKFVKKIFKKVPEKYSNYIFIFNTS